MIVLPLGSKRYLFIPWYGPSDPTGLAVDLALIPQDQTAPASSDWVAGVWASPSPGAAKEAAYLFDTTTGPLAAGGEFMLWTRLHADPELVPQPSVRVRIGDTRGATV